MFCEDDDEDWNLVLCVQHNVVSLDAQITLFCKGDTRIVQEEEEWEGGGEAIGDRGCQPDVVSQWYLEQL